MDITLKNKAVLLKQGALFPSGYLAVSENILTFYNLHMRSYLHEI